MTVETTKVQVILYMIITGLGMGAVYPTIGTAAQMAVDPQMRGVATSSSQFFRSIGGTIGVSVLGSLLSQQMVSGLGELSEKINSFSENQLQHFTNPQILLDTKARNALPKGMLIELQSIFSNSLNHVFTVGVMFVCIGLIASVFFGNDRLVKPKTTKDS